MAVLLCVSVVSYVTFVWFFYGGSSLCVCGFICSICVVLFCSSCLLLLVSWEGFVSLLWHFTYIFIDANLIRCVPAIIIVRIAYGFSNSSMDQHSKEKQITVSILSPA